MIALFCQGMTSVMPQEPRYQHGFTGRGKRRQRCHPEAPLGVRDLHLRWYLHWHLRLHWNLLFFYLKFQI